MCFKRGLNVGEGVLKHGKLYSLCCYANIVSNIFSQR